MAAIKQDKICGTCVAWNEIGVADKGECRKSPPTTHGWPKTAIRDWCLDGWKKTSKVISENAAKATEPQDTSSLAFNYHYLAEHSENACNWLRAVLAESEIPEVIADMFKNGLSETPTMHADDCDSVLGWAHRLPGFAVNEDDDKNYEALIIYTDVKSDYEKSSKSKPLFDDLHQFMVLLQANLGKLDKQVS